VHGISKLRSNFLSLCDSRSVGIFKVQFCSGVLKRMQPSTIAHKAMTYGDQQGCLVFIQLLHSLTL
jgi:hypothetical protein